MSLSTAEYLDQKGAIELLCELNPNGSRFNELVDAVSISRPTVATRLAQGVDAFILDQEVRRFDEESVTVYVFTEEGAGLRVLFDYNGVTAEYRAYKNARERFQQKVRWAREYVQAESTSLPRKPYERGLAGLLRQRYAEDDTEE